MIFAYADPPYIGQAKKHYGTHPDYAGEVDHAVLIARLVAEFPDGWALSLSAQSLQRILALCPDDVRVLIWVKRYHGMLPGLRLQYGYEPVIMRGGRQGPHVTGETTLRDWVDCNPEAWTFREMPPNHVTGKKPAPFCWWLFECLGMQSGDELVDLFPGTGAVTQAWERFRRNADLYRVHR
ncbi:MAG: hypothetical protein ABFD94_18895 [Armatimonadia bacterium]